MAVRAVSDIAIDRGKELKERRQIAVMGENVEGDDDECTYMRIKLYLLLVM